MQEVCKHDIEMLEMEAWQNEIAKKKSDAAKQRVKKPTFNFGSSAQVAKLLYERLHLPVQKNQKTRSVSVDKHALLSLNERHPVVGLLRSHHELSKVQTGFIEGTLKAQRNGRVFPDFLINGTVTGRIACHSPNMQNIPAKGDWVRVRGIFIPDDGQKLISADYSQLEICVAAHYSQDPNLLKIIREGVSQHDITNDSLGLNNRDIAKRLNFAIQYGAGVKKVADIIGCNLQQATAYLERYWHTYSGLKRLIDSCSRQVNDGNPITSIFGRKRHFERKKRTQWDKAYRQAFNSLIQGTGADITHAAFVRVSKRLRDSAWGRSLIEVHDEIVVSAKENACKEVQEMLRSEMLAVGKEIGLTVPLAVEVSEPMERWSK